MPAFGALGAIKDKASGVFGRNPQYEEFEFDGKPGYEGTFARGSSESLPSPERPPLRHIDKYVRAECPCLSKRYTVALLTCIGFIISFGMRCNMGMAKLQLEHGNETFQFNWTVAMESAVDSSFFWGYLVTQIPGGFLASLYPANRIFGTAIVMSCSLNLLVPGAMSLHPTVLIVVRVLQGLVEGVTYPACHGIWRFWAPPLERSRLATLAFCGSYAGVVLGMPLSGILTGWIGWHAPFYFYGVAGIIWYFFWLWLTFEKPSKHPTISARELLYIEQSLGQSIQVAMPTFATTPWRDFSRSLPVYAIIVANFCRSWNFYLLVLFQSSFLQSRFKFRIEETGLVGALPHLLMTIIVPLGGMLADYVRKSGLLSTTNVRKLFNCGGFGMEAFFFIIIAYSQTAFTATTALTMGVAFSGFAISGYNVNHLDIAPRYASILMGLSNGIGTIAGLICPIVVDNITTPHKDREHWKIVFLIAATIHAIGISFYGLFASGDLQPWAEPTEEQQKAWGGINKQKSIDSNYKETALDGAQNTALTHQDSLPSYGAVQQATHVAGNPFASVPSGNPFASGNYIQEEPIQPEPQDSYMHGGINDRTY